MGSCGVLVILTISILCLKYPVFSYCCCCLPIKIRRKMRDYCRNECCGFCDRFSFGVLYDDNIAELMKRKRQERRRNLQLRNELMEEQHHLNATDNDEVDEKEEKYQKIEKKQHKKIKKRKKRKKKKKEKSIRGDAIEQNEQIAMTEKNKMLYHDPNRDVLEENESNIILI